MGSGGDSVTSLDDDDDERCRPSDDGPSIPPLLLELVPIIYLSLLLVQWTTTINQALECPPAAIVIWLTRVLVQVFEREKLKNVL